ncbi:hypothetical protein BO443_100103 [Burkholderia orbicola]
MPAMCRGTRWWPTAAIRSRDAPAACRAAASRRGGRERRFPFRMQPQRGPRDPGREDCDHAAEGADPRQPEVARDMVAEQRAGADADVVQPRVDRHGQVGRVRRQLQHPCLHRQPETDDRAAPHQRVHGQRDDVQRAREQDQQAARQRDDRRQQEIVGPVRIDAIEANRGRQPGDAEQDQHVRDPAVARMIDALHERFDVRVRREVRGYDQHGDRIQRDQRRLAQEHADAAQRPGALAGQQRQRGAQQQQRDARRARDDQERDAPAERLADHASERNPGDHRDRRAHRDQAERAALAVARREPHRERDRNRPEHRMRTRDAEPADHQHREIPRDAGHDMAADEHQQRHAQQLAALDVARDERQRQRHDRDRPRVDRQHQADRGRLHLQAVADRAQQCDGYEFGGIEDEGGERQGQNAPPRLFGTDGVGGCHTGIRRRLGAHGRPARRIGAIVPAVFAPLPPGAARAARDMAVTRPGADNVTNEVLPTICPTTIGPGRVTCALKRHFCSISTARSSTASISTCSRGRKRSMPKASNCRCGASTARSG